MNVPCPKCKSMIQIGMDPATAFQAQMNVEAEKGLRITQVEADGDIKIEKQRQQRLLIQEIAKTYDELSKVLRKAESGSSRTQELARQGATINPTTVTILSEVALKIAEKVDQLRDMAGV